MAHMFPVSLIMPVRERAAMREFETAAPVPFFAAVHNVASNHGVVAGRVWTVERMVPYA